MIVSDIAVVIAAVNAAETLGDQLAALSRQVDVDPFEIVVVDNRSTDGTAKVVERWSAANPSIRMVKAGRLACAGYARNEGVRATNADFLLFADSDDVVSDSWVATMVEALERFDMVGGVVDEVALNPPEVLAWTKPRANPLEVAHSFLAHAIGTNLGIRRDAFESIGGWAESFPKAASEDIEISWRAQLAGYKLGEAPEGIVKYRHRHTLVSVARQYYRRGRNDQALCRAYAEFMNASVQAPAVETGEIGSSGPKRAEGVAKVALSIARALPRTITSIEARGYVLRQLSSAFGWMVEGLLFRLQGGGPIDDELRSLLAGLDGSGGTSTTLPLTRLGRVIGK